LEERYNQFVNAAELHFIHLKSLVVERRPWTSISEEGLFEIESLGKHRLALTDVDQDLFILEAQVTVEAISSSREGANDKEQENLFSIDCIFELGYTYEPAEMPDGVLPKDGAFTELVERFAGRNIQLNVWPYVRELTQSLTARMGISPVVLPLYKPRVR